MKNSQYFIGALVIYSFLLIACMSGESIKNEIIAAADKIIVPEVTPAPYLPVPEGWVLFPTPKENSEELQCANWSRNEQKVENENGNVKFSKYVDTPDEQLSKLPIKLKEQILKNRNTRKGLGGYLHIESFNNGWLIGSDAGEWGGKLFWFSEDANRSAELLVDNIRGIAKINDEIFILSGINHGIDEGKVYKLVKDEKENLKTQLLIDLKTQPQTFIVENNGSLLITLNDKIVRLKKSGEIETLKEVNFSSLYPNSMMLASSGIIYVGMRLFVVRFVPGEKGYIEQWLVPQDCQPFAKKGYDCVCQNEK